MPSITHGIDSREAKKSWNENLNTVTDDHQRISIDFRVRQQTEEYDLLLFKTIPLIH